MEPHKDPRKDEPVDEDMRKGAVESTPDQPVPAPRGKSPKDASVDVTENATDSDPAAVKRAEDELGADEDGTPG